MVPTRLTAARGVGLALCAFIVTPFASAVTVASNLSTPTLVAILSGGQSYSVTASGISNLYVSFNSGAGLTFTADGKPTYAFPSPYSAFYPNGLDYDPSAGPGNYGIGGPGKLLGALLGTFSAAPSAPSDYFTIGLGTTLNPVSTTTLYAVVNDTFYADNSLTGYTVTASAVTAVPEPTSAGLLLAGLGALGWAVRRRRET